MSYSDRFRVKPRSRVDLKKVKTDDTGDLKDKVQAQTILTAAVARIAEAQEVLFAQNSRSVLIIFQAMDAAGKDSAVKHVFSGVNPRGVQVTSFGVPSKDELDHDYLWRVVKALPSRGIIGVHNRSHYEEVLVVRVHPEFLDAQRLPDPTRGVALYRRRFREINHFERYLVDNGTLVLKFFLHISKHEQWERLTERMEDPQKYWKSRPGDLQERLRWADYMAAYEDVFHHTSMASAPWFIIPADHKWFVWVAVAEIINEAMAKLKLEYPGMPAGVREEWEQAREQLRKA
ncbi:MAG: polyphosphate kinase 2 family protein [Acidobacteriota bacterium]